VKRNIIIACILFFGQLSYGRMITAVTATVGNHAVTTREVKINAAIESILYSSNPNEAGKALKRMVLSSEAFNKEVKRVLLEWVVFYEAKTFALADVPAKELLNAKKMVQRMLKTSSFGFLRPLEPTQAEITRTIQRKLRAKKFIQFKSKASMVPITDGEALKYYQANRSRYGGSFSKFRSKIKDLLQQKAAQRRLRDWFLVLQRKHNVRQHLSRGR
jgi:hypothetical protein